MNRILIAPNTYKNSLSAGSVALKIEEGLSAVLPKTIFLKHPIGDGGDGTGSLIVKHKKGRVVEANVRDPLGRWIKSEFGLIDRGETAVIEMAQASGINLVKEERLNPLKASSMGTGDLIKCALDYGISKIVLAIGGSATVDGGVGILHSLGARFYNSSNNELSGMPFLLENLENIDLSGLDRRLNNCEIVVLCDVDNPLLGPSGAASVFGPQKGASPTDVRTLEQALRKFSSAITKTTGKEVSKIKYGGAAGGVAAGMFGVLNAKLVNGLEYFFQLTEFAETLKTCDLVITGEGLIDSQTLNGKGPYGVALLARKFNIPVIGLAGSIDVDLESDLWNYFDALFSINLKLSDKEQAITATAENLRLISKSLARMIKLL